MAKNKQDTFLKIITNAIQKFDVNALNKLAAPQAAEDLNTFLEKMPQNAGQTMLIVAAVVWSAAGAVGLFATVQLQTMSQVKLELQEAKALKPIVPVVKRKPVNASKVKAFTEDMSSIYKGLEIKPSGAAINITSTSTAAFGQFREAIGHVQNGGSGWKMDIEKLCVGRECGDKALKATLRINTISVSLGQ